MWPACHCISQSHFCNIDSLHDDGLRMFSIKSYSSSDDAFMCTVNRSAYIGHNRSRFNLRLNVRLPKAECHQDLS